MAGGEGCLLTVVCGARYTFKLALDKTIAEEGEMTEEEHKTHKELQHKARVQQTLFGPFTDDNSTTPMEAALEKERKRAEKYDRCVQECPARHALTTAPHAFSRWRAARREKVKAMLKRRRDRGGTAMPRKKKVPKRVESAKWPTPKRVNKMKVDRDNIVRRTSVDKALEKVRAAQQATLFTVTTSQLPMLRQVTSLMSALGGEDSLLAHVFLTSDLHSIPVPYPNGFYKASNWEGRCLQADPEATGQAQLAHAYSGIIAAHNARTRSSAAVEFGVRVIVKQAEASLVDAIFTSCMTRG